MRHTTPLALALAVGLLGAGYFANRAGGQPTPALFPLVRVEYLPRPRDIVNLVQGTPYTVPTGKVFVVRDFESSNAGGATLSLTINGSTVWESAVAVHIQPGASSSGWATESHSPNVSLTVGLIAKSGEVVEVKSSSGTAYG